MLVQVAIVLFSALGIWFINQDRPWAKWGNVLGLIAQPFWLVTTYQNEQWGMFLLTVFYIYCWCQGIYNNFFKHGARWQNNNDCEARSI